MLDKITILSAENFNNFTSNKDCLLLIFKNLCPHCKVLMTVNEKCLPAYPDLIMAGINSESTSNLDVSKVPTVLIFKMVCPQLAGRCHESCELSALISKSQAH